MERRNWPWKKKSSDKAVADKPGPASDANGAPLSSVASLGDQDKYKKVNYVQISMDSYVHLTGLEEQVKMLNDQVKIFEDEVKDLKEKLSVAHSEIDAKDNLIKQHAKVSEEAVSGWEKAGAEALALKHQLESVTLLKLKAEERASYLDGALKECMRQIRNVKEESEQKLCDVILTKTKQWDKIKLDLEVKIVELDKEILQAVAEKATLSGSLQEQSNLIMKLEEEKSQANAERELLKKEINSLKYELHMVSKELDIRNEEKNISVRSAEVASKQHLESVKIIAKLEAECQKLRGLVRKKLPGPAALAQMKLEVDSLGQNFSEPKAWRTAVKNANPHLSPRPDFSFENLQQCHKEIDFFSTRLLAMEEETKMLKEALATRNSELQASRNMCAKTSDRLRTLEAEMEAINQQRISSNSTFGISADGPSSQYSSCAPSITLTSGDGISEKGSSIGLWAPPISNASHLGRGNSIHKSNTGENANHLELMEDFLEMERLACLTSDANAPRSISSHIDNAGNCKPEKDKAASLDHFSEEEPQFNSSPKQDSSNVSSSPTEDGPDADNLPFLKLQSKFSMIFESQSKEMDVKQVLEDIKCAIQEIQGSLPQQSITSFSEELKMGDAFSNGKACFQETSETGKSEILLDQDSSMKESLASEISHIHQFVMSIAREVMRVQDISTDGHGLSKTLEGFSTLVNEFIFNEMSLINFVLKLSRVLSKVNELKLGAIGFKGCEGDASSGDYIDKVALPRNEVFQDNTTNQTCIDGCHHIFHSCSCLEAPQEGNSNPSLQPDVSSCTCLLKKLEQLKLEKDNMVVELSRSTLDLEKTKSQLQETEQTLTEMKLQQASSQNLYSLSETQLKCMTESYKSLEVRAHELEAQVNLLQEKLEKLDNELLDEKHSHQNALGRCKELEDKLQRNETSLMRSLSSVEDPGIKFKQEREVLAAAEKLAACQETIYLLGKQLQALRPQVQICQYQYNEKLQLGESLGDGKLNHSVSEPQSVRCSNDYHQAETDSLGSTDVRSLSEETWHYCNSTSSPSDIEANLPVSSLASSSNANTKLTTSSSCSSSSPHEQEKRSRGFGRFFSSKGKNGL